MWIHVQEAVRHAHTAFTELKVPEHVKALMDDEKCTNLTASSSDFWIALAALKRFVVRMHPLCITLVCKARSSYILLACTQTNLGYLRVCCSIWNQFHLLFALDWLPGCRRLKEKGRCL